MQGAFSNLGWQWKFGIWNGFFSSWHGESLPNLNVTWLYDQKLEQNDLRFS